MGGFNNNIKLGILCEILNGFAFKSNKYVNEGIRVIRITNVQKGHIVDDDPKYYPYEELNNIRQYTLRENDLLMSLTGNVGRVGLLNQDMLPAALNQRVACLRIKDNRINLNYLFHCLNSPSFEHEAINAASGIAQKNMITEWLKDYLIPTPPLPEQQKIVEELDCLSNMIELKKKQLETYDKLAQSIFYDMFGDPIANEKEFPVYKIDDIITFQGGSQPDKSYFEYEPTKDNIRLIQIRDYKSDKNITYIPKSMARRLCTADDIMIGRYGPPIFQILRGIEGAYNVALMKATPKKGNKEFIRAFLKQKCLLEYLESMSKRTAGQDGIQMDKLKLYPFPFPPLSLQQQFAEKIEAIEKQKELIKQTLKGLEELFNSRMDYYFN